MIIASVESDRFPVLNELNDIPFISSFIIACVAMLPMFVIHELVQEAFGRNEIFDLSFTFFLNNMCLHLFLTFILDIRVKLFFIPLTLFCFVLSLMDIGNGI